MDFAPRAVDRELPRLELLPETWADSSKPRPSNSTPPRHVRRVRGPGRVEAGLAKLDWPVNRTSRVSGPQHFTGSVCGDGTSSNRAVWPSKSIRCCQLTWIAPGLASGSPFMSRSSGNSICPEPSIQSRFVPALTLMLVPVRVNPRPAKLGGPPDHRDVGVRALRVDRLDAVAADANRLFRGWEQGISSSRRRLPASIPTIPLSARGSARGIAQAGLARGIAVGGALPGSPRAARQAPGGARQQARRPAGPCQASWLAAVAAAGRPGSSNQTSIRLTPPKICGESISTAYRAAGFRSPATGSSRGRERCRLGAAGWRCPPRALGRACGRA